MSSLINQRFVVSLSLTINTFVDNSWSDFQSDHTLFLEARSRGCCTVLSSNLYTVASGYVTVLFNRRLMLFWFGWNSDGGPSTGTFYNKKLRFSDNIELFLKARCLRMLLAYVRSFNHACPLVLVDGRVYIQAFVILAVISGYVLFTNYNTLCDHSLSTFPIFISYGQARIKVGVGPRHCTTVGPSVSHLSPSIHTAKLLVSLAT